MRRWMGEQASLTTNDSWIPPTVLKHFNQLRWWCGGGLFYLNNPTILQVKDSLKLCSDVCLPLPLSD